MSNKESNGENCSHWIWKRRETWVSSRKELFFESDIAQLLQFVPPKVFRKWIYSHFEIAVCFVNFYIICFWFSSSLAVKKREQPREILILFMYCWVFYVWQLRTVSKYKCWNGYTIIYFLTVRCNLIGNFSVPIEIFHLCN